MVKKILARKKRLRSILSFVVAAVIIGSISYLGVKTYHDSHAATGASIYVNPGSGTLTAGSIVSITVRENSGTDPINTVQASLNYDSNSLQYSSISESGSFPVVAATSTDTPGVVRIGRGNANNPLTGDVAVVTINFKVIGASGTGTITVDKAYSFLVRSTDNTDILQSVGNGSYTLTGTATPPPPSPTPTPPPPSPTGAPLLYMSPSAGTYNTGDTLSASVRISSGTSTVTTVEAIVGYPTNQLQYVSVSEGGVYTVQQRTKNANGTVDIIRGTAGGSDGITGDNSLVTINFKVIGSDGSVPLTINGGSAAYDKSGTGTNILDLTNSVGATYTISGSDGGGSVVNGSGGLSILPKDGGHASLGTSDQGVVTELQGQVTLSPTTATNGTSAISKVEYYLDGKLLATKNTTPYSYNFDTRKQRNGTHTMLVKTYYANGTVDTKTSSLLVKNKITLTYVLRQYAPSALVLIAILAVCTFLVLKLVIPRFAFARHSTTHGVVDYDVMHGSNDISATHSPVMADPIVVAPTNSAFLATDVVPGGVQVDKAAQITEALPIQGVSPTTQPSTVITPSSPSASPSLNYDAEGVIEPHVIRPTVITPDSDIPPKL